MDSIRVPSGSSDGQVVDDSERMRQYIMEQDQRLALCHRAAAIRIAQLRNHTSAHDLVPAGDLQVLQEILEITSARVRRRLTGRFNHAPVHQLSRGIGNHEHRRRARRTMMTHRVVPSHHGAHLQRPLLSANQQGRQQQGENAVHERMARVQGEQDHGQERVGDTVGEQTARLQELELQDADEHLPLLPTVPSFHTDDDDVKDV